MKFVWAALVSASLLCGCAKKTQNTPFPSPPPQDSEYNHKVRFLTNPLVQEYAKNGIVLDCENVCSRITQAHVDLLRNHKNDFFKRSGLVRKITFTTTAVTKLNFDSVYFPTDLHGIDIENLLPVLQRLGKLISLSGRDCFYSGGLIEAFDAIDTVTKKVSTIKTWPEGDLRISSDTTSYSQKEKSIFLNTTEVTRNFDGISSKIELYKLFFETFPGMEFTTSIPFTEDAEAYQIIESMIAQKEKVSQLVGDLKFGLDLLNENSDGLYAAGRSYLFKTSFIAVPYQYGLAKILDIINYEVQLTEFAQTIKKPLFYVDGMAHRDQYKSCQMMLNDLVDPIVQKRKFISEVLIDYVQNQPTRLQGDVLIINCANESPQHIINVINTIEVSNE